MFEIRGKYPGCPWETVDAFDTREEALTMLREYRKAFGPEWTLTIRRAKR